MSFSSHPQLYSRGQRCTLLSVFAWICKETTTFNLNYTSQLSILFQQWLKQNYILTKTNGSAVLAVHLCKSNQISQTDNLDSSEKLDPARPPALLLLVLFNVQLNVNEAVGSGRSIRSTWIMNAVLCTTRACTQTDWRLLFEDRPVWFRPQQLVFQSGKDTPVYSCEVTAHSGAEDPHGGGTSSSFISTASEEECQRSHGHVEALCQTGLLQK